MKDQKAYNTFMKKETKRILKQKRLIRELIKLESAYPDLEIVDTLATELLVLSHMLEDHLAYTESRLLDVIESKGDSK
jgi:hypothetical protein